VKISQVIGIFSLKRQEQPCVCVAGRWITVRVVSGDVVREKAMELGREWAGAMSVNGSLKILRSRWGPHTTKRTGESASNDLRLAGSTQSI
jgi:hypothetical protein